MSVHAGSILHVGGDNVIDRVQSAGLGDVRVPTEVIREVGNREVVDKVTGDPEFTFTLESLDVSTELEAWLTGARGTGQGSAQAPGFADPDGTEYSWLDCQTVNIVSPWKDPDSGSAGTVQAGHIVPGYYPTSVRYQFGVTDNARQSVDLAGGAYYYGKFAPVEQFFTGDGATDAFATGSAAVGYRIGGADGTSFKRIYGVLVDGQLQTRDVDYTETTGAVGAAAGVATITFTDPPANGADIRFCYFTTAAKAWPQTRHASTVTKPAAVRGRNICVFIGGVLIGGVQSVELTATVDSAVEREFCNEEIIGRSINGTDTNGSLTVRSKDADAFFALLAQVTGVPVTEIYGWLNDHPVELEIQLRNPKDPATTLKTLYVSDAKFQVPGTPARVNAPTDFVLGWESKSGTYSAFKGERP
jgi:hypothetical protein